MSNESKSKEIISMYRDSIESSMKELLELSQSYNKQSFKEAKELCIDIIMFDRDEDVKKLIHMSDCLYDVFNDYLLESI